MLRRFCFDASARRTFAQQFLQHLPRKTTIKHVAPATAAPYILAASPAAALEHQVRRCSTAPPQQGSAATDGGPTEAVPAWAATADPETAATEATFADRHIGPSHADIDKMLAALGYASLDALVRDIVPANIQRDKLGLPMAEIPSLSEAAALDHYAHLTRKNKANFKSLIGQGYYECITPPAILRNMLENPQWYTPYTPYQSEIAQGRMEASLNFQTAVAELTGLDFANSSLLDQATAAAEAMRLSKAYNAAHCKCPTANVFLVDHRCFTATIEMVKQRAVELKVDVVVCDLSGLAGRENGLEGVTKIPIRHVGEYGLGGSSVKEGEGEEPPSFDLEANAGTVCGILVQSPDALGAVHDFSALFRDLKKRRADIVISVATDLLALTRIKTPGEMRADVALGSAQRFGIPLGYGGPHAAFFAMREGGPRHPEPRPKGSKPFVWLTPGRFIGVSKELAPSRPGAKERPALRLTLCSREQHISFAAATSNICTAQALLANISSMYAVYHGPKGLTAIANRCHRLARIFAQGMSLAGHTVVNSGSFFDTVTVRLAAGEDGDKAADASSASPTEKNSPAVAYAVKCAKRHINVAVIGRDTVTVAMDEATLDEHIVAMLECAGMREPVLSSLDDIATTNSSGGESAQSAAAFPERQTAFLTQRIFNAHHNETSLLRYIYTLCERDYGLQHGIIPLGSCTMKLNPAATMLPLSWPAVGNIHPLAPQSQAEGYRAIAIALENLIKSVTGFDAVSLQPNAGSQGEYAGLSVIRAFQKSRGEGHRDVVIIPGNAHGTNVASAVLAGMKHVSVKCHPDGTLDTQHLKEIISGPHKGNICCAMITYPSTYGVFDENIREIVDLVHSAGGQVYIDGANMNAMVGHTGPGVFQGDVCHLNLHKTFSIPHGGGGPGMGPIGVKAHLAPFLPRAPRTYLREGNSSEDASSSAKSSEAAATPAEAPSDCPQLIAPSAQVGGTHAFGLSSQAAYGSASINGISYLLMAMLGTTGMKRSSAVALLSANYMEQRLKAHYKIEFVSPRSGRCAHEFIVSFAKIKERTGIDSEDVAKRLMDYGFHSPTVSFPVNNTLMIEPTESEPLCEMERFIEAMIQIRQEIRDVEEGKQPKEGNVLKNAPHPAAMVTADEWPHPYTRETAAYPTPHQRARKFWPTIRRVNNPFGDKHLRLSTFADCTMLAEVQELPEAKN